MATCRGEMSQVSMKERLQINTFVPSMLSLASSFRLESESCSVRNCMMEATRESLGFLELDMLVLQTGETLQKGKATKSESKNWL